jgi:hypothetical protein
MIPGGSFLQIQIRRQVQYCAVRVGRSHQLPLRVCYCRIRTKAATGPIRSQSFNGARTALK